MPQIGLSQTNKAKLSPNTPPQCRLQLPPRDPDGYSSIAHVLDVREDEHCEQNGHRNRYKDI